MNQKVHTEVNSIRNGWNSINISNLIKQTTNNQNGSHLDVLIIKCNKECIIEIDRKTIIKPSKLPILYLSKQYNQKPLLQINNEVKIPIVNKKKAKRSVKDERTAKVSDDNSENESASNYQTDADSTIGSNLCKNNVGHPNQECCLVSHYVSFNVLKWSNWVISPAGYRANYCIGRCTTLKGTKQKSFFFFLKHF